ncbi:phytanoyl-CoA dioxygenase family protein [Corallococcus carmarthensis]|nr:phytanoyl-CoA dioxygenase family protein [Corallococcus carmarthensis]
MEEAQVLRKGFALRQLMERLSVVEDLDFWRRLQPEAPITEHPWKALGDIPAPGRPEEARELAARLRHEGYFQTGPLVPEAMIRQMRSCIEAVRKAGFPPMFALVYDVFYQALAHARPTLEAMLGEDFQLVPNFWVYYVETKDDGKGFEPHRDAEYPDTIGVDGMPTVLTVWVALTDATPLNSCIYVVPIHRDPQYPNALRNLRTGGQRIALEDIRALPTQAGTVSCWNQYIYHWGSRSSQRARVPRISYALYCQRGDVSAVDDVRLDPRGPIGFGTRVALICRSLYRYSHLSIQENEDAMPLRAFMARHGVPLNPSRAVGAPPSTART